MKNSSDCPIISFIIATKNCARDLVVTLQSFVESDAGNYEIYIQDGMSDDATPLEAEKFSHALPIVICREKDSGIYDAWNKAIHHVRGQWILFMGAGDTLHQKNSITELLQTLTSLPQNIQYYCAPIVHVFPPDEELEILRPDRNPLQGLLNGMCLPHQGLFHRRDLFADTTFDASYRIAGDYDFVCRTLTAHNFCIGETPFVRMVFGGISSSMGNMASREKEFFRIARKAYPASMPWKILARLVRWQGVYGASVLGGDAFGRMVADLPRRLRGKPPLWSRRIPALPSRDISAPTIDLLIATVGRVEELDRLLSSLEAQTYKNFRVLLADQNAPGHLDALLARHSGLPLERIMLPSNGVSIARNVLLEASAGAIIAFPDDDCWYAPDTLQRVQESFCNHPSCGGLLGVWTPSPTTHVHAVPDGVINSRAKLFQLAGTCVQFYRGEAVAGIRFDPRLGPGTGLPYGSGEDTDYLLSVFSRTEVRRNTKIRVFHPSPREIEATAQKVTKYAAGRMYLLKKHKFSALFILFNVLYPLCLIPVDAVRFGKSHAVYRWRMFMGRLRNWGE